MSGCEKTTDGECDGGSGGNVPDLEYNVPPQLLINGGSTASTTTTDTFNFQLNSPTGTGNLVLSTNPTLTNPTLVNVSTFSISSLTPLQAVATNATKDLVSVPNTGTGNNVLATSPTLITPNIGVAVSTGLQMQNLSPSAAIATNAGRNLVSVTNTGTGNNVLATSPILVTPSLGNAAATRIYISANAGLFGYIRSNELEFYSPTSLNPGIIVHRSDAGRAFGFDCGFNSIYSSRIFSPPEASFVYATHVAGVLPTAQSSFTNRFIVTGAGVVNIPNLTASQAVATDASKNLISVANTGSGNNVLATGPTIENLNITGDSNLLGNIDIGSISSPGSLDVFGPVKFNGNVEIGSILSTANLTINGDMSVQSPGAVTVTSAGVVTVSSLSGGVVLSAGTGTCSITTGAGALTITGGAGGIAVTAGTGALALTTAAGAMTFTGGAGGIAMTAGAGALALSTGTGLLSLTTGIGGCLISTGAGGLALTTGVGALALSTGLGGIALTTAGGILATNTFAGDTSFTTTVGSIKMTCGTGNAEISSSSGAVNIFGQGGGVNIGDNTTFCGHLIVQTRNGATGPQTGNVEFYTNKTGSFTGPGDFSVNTINAVRGRCQFDINEDFIVTAQNVKLNNLTPLQAVATNASRNLISVPNTGTGNNVLATGPVFSGNTSFDSLSELRIDGPSTSGGRVTITADTILLRDFITNFQLSSSTNLRIDAPFTPFGRLAITATNFEIGTAITSFKVNYLSASQSLATDASKNFVSVPNTGTGNNVLATSPTLVTPTIGVASATSLTLSGLATSQAVATNGSRTLISVPNTGTGNNVLSTNAFLDTPTIDTPQINNRINFTPSPSFIFCNLRKCFEFSDGSGVVTNTSMSITNANNSILDNFGPGITMRFWSNIRGSGDGLTYDAGLGTFTNNLNRQIAVTVSYTAKRNTSGFGLTAFWIQMNPSATTARFAACDVAANDKAAGTCTLLMNNTDQFELRVYQNSGSTQTCNSGDQVLTYTFL